MQLTKNGALYTYTLVSDDTVRVTENTLGLEYTISLEECKRAIRDRMSRGWVEA